MEEGYIKLYRKMLDNPIICNDNDYFRVWVQLLLMATHKEMKVVFGNDTKILRQGELITGRDEIAKKCNISSSKVERILKRLKTEHQIEQQTSTKGRLITVLNWEQYQKSEQQNEQQVNNKWTTSEQQVDTNKNDKNIKKDNNKLLSKEKTTKPTLEDIKSYCIERGNSVDPSKFYDYYESNGWMVGKNKMKDWKACVRTWERNSYQTTTTSNEQSKEVKWDGNGGFRL